VSPSKPDDFGALLRIAREGRGLTLQGISETTRIPIAALQALEQNDIARLPGRFYSRSFVRAYAREVGLDPAATVEAFLDAFPGQRPDRIEEPRDTPRGSERVASRRDFDRTAVGVALMSLSVIGFLLFFGLRGTDDPDVERAVAPTEEAAAALSEPPPELEREAPAGLPPSAVPDYTVLNRLPAAADVVIPSLSREDEDREQVLRAIATIEELDPAFFFSTEEAVEAHQALLPSPDQLEDLQAGFLGQVRGGEFTPGEDVYPD
jgi:transcriptional regulator with XRE-family HTH domain